MKNTLLVMILSCYFTTFVGAADASTIFEKYPQIESFRLADGESVKLPVHYTDFTMASVIGFGNYDVVAAELKGHNLVPLQFAKNEAMIILYTFDYAKSSLGKYHEAVIGIPVVSEKTDHNDAVHSVAAFYSSFLPSLKDPRETKNYSLFIYKIMVDSELGKRAGDEIWNFQKDFGTIALDKTDDKFSFTFHSPTCSVEANVNAKTKIFAPSALNFPLLTVGKIDAPTTGFALSALGTAKNTVTVNSSQSCGDFLNRANYHPTLWQYGKNGKLILFKKD